MLVRTSGPRADIDSVLGRRRRLQSGGRDLLEVSHAFDQTRQFRRSCLVGQTVPRVLGVHLGEPAVPPQLIDAAGVEPFPHRRALGLEVVDGRPGVVHLVSKRNPDRAGVPLLGEVSQVTSLRTRNFAIPGSSFFGPVAAATMARTSPPKSESISAAVVLSGSWSSSTSCEQTGDDLVVGSEVFQHDARHAQKMTQIPDLFAVIVRCALAVLPGVGSGGVGHGSADAVRGG